MGVIWAAALGTAGFGAFVVTKLRAASRKVDGWLDEAELFTRLEATTGSDVDAPEAADRPA
ncbi:hypothetical protein [Lentzea sp. E54]|uniref:hypothetical protein n=1 Tax=Lentzea xerophila TaxID=3435883 RepID=UPI003DA5ED5C